MGQPEAEVEKSEVPELFGAGPVGWELGLEFLFKAEAELELIHHHPFLFPKFAQKLLFALLRIFGKVLQAFFQTKMRRSPLIS